MENNPGNTFFVILMPKDRIGSIHIGEKPEWPVEVLQSSDVEKPEFKTKALERLAGDFTVKITNKKFKMSDVYRMTGVGSPYLDYLRIEGSLENLSKSIELIQLFMKEFGAQHFPWVLIGYDNQGVLELPTKNRYHQYVFEYWKKHYPQEISQDKTTEGFRHPDKDLNTSRVKPKWR